MTISDSITGANLDSLAVIRFAGSHTGSSYFYLGFERSKASPLRNRFTIRNGTGTFRYLCIDSTHRVGIFDTVPDYRFDVKGTIHSDSGILADENIKAMDTIIGVKAVKGYKCRVMSYNDSAAGTYIALDKMSGNTPNLTTIALPSIKTDFASMYFSTADTNLVARFGRSSGENLLVLYDTAGNVNTRISTGDDTRFYDDVIIDSVLTVGSDITMDSDWYMDTTFTVSATSFVPDQSITIRVLKIGKQATVRISEFAGTADHDAFAITMPAKFAAPASDMRYDLPHEAWTENGSAAANTYFIINDTTWSLDGVSFTSSGTRALNDAISITYILD
jgi:hypothetical protein